MTALWAWFYMWIHLGTFDSPPSGWGAAMIICVIIDVLGVIIRATK